MKTTNVITTLIVGAACWFAPQSSRAQDIDNFAPVVIKTVPEAGSKDVSPGEFEVKITFSKEMADQSWSWSTAWENSSPESVDKPHYDADRKTCVMKVKLEPGKTYGWWINSGKFHGFQDTKGHPAIPYLFTFKVKNQ
ncbi:MAG: Ig-like domain-containing protein [Verrucomicrobiota bacterium]|jgi:RNA polymerase sigma-70 factor (ECF subfamily)